MQYDIRSNIMMHYLPNFIWMNVIPNPTNKMIYWKHFKVCYERKINNYYLILPRTRNLSFKSISITKTWFLLQNAKQQKHRYRFIKMKSNYNNLCLKYFYTQQLWLYSVVDQIVLHVDQKLVQKEMLHILWREIVCFHTMCNFNLKLWRTDLYAWPLVLIRFVESTDNFK